MAAQVVLVAGVVETAEQEKGNKGEKMGFQNLSPLRNSLPISDSVALNSLWSL